MRLATVLAVPFLVAAFAGAPPAHAADKSQSGPKPVKFRASDGRRLAADYIPPARKGLPVFVLLHGLGAGRGEWSGFRRALLHRGYGSLALDARGHGGSEGPRYTTFRSSAAWAALERDVEGALSYLKRKGIPSSRVVLGGASMGANISLRVAARRDVPFVLLLSPGYDYRGIRIGEALSRLSSPAVLAAAPNDPYAYRTCLWASPRLLSKESEFLRAASGHGVQMLEGKTNAPFAERLMLIVERLVGILIPPAPSPSKTDPTPGRNPEN